MTQIRIISKRNGVGLDRDIALIDEALRPTFEPEYCSTRDFSFARPLFNRLLTSSREDCPLNLHIERVDWLWSHCAGRTLLIPNQERFPLRHASRLKRVDLVLAKSCHAETIFKRYTPNVLWTGFTSCDRRLTPASPDYSRFFHLAGRSTAKGTETILELWARHPEWPVLTLVQAASNAPNSVPPNVNQLAGRLSDHELQQLQNSHGIHLCPSRSEGWGHYIVEAMSCAAVVVTTDGPPMNELVTAERGVLVPWNRSEPRHLGVNYYADPDALEASIQSLIEMPTTQKSRLGEAARFWYEANDLGFRSRFRHVFECLLSAKNDAAWNDTIATLSLPPAEIRRSA